MVKKLRIYQISLIAVSMLCIGLLAFMGITAIQKSMTLKMQFSAEPTVACKFAIRQADSTEAYNPIFKNYEDTTISNGVSLTQNILRFTGGDYATATGTAIDLQYTNATTKCSAIKLTITGATVNKVAPYSIFIPQGNTATIENISSPAGGTIQFKMEYVAEITFNLSYAQISSVSGLTLKPNTTNTYYAVYGTSPSATLTATQNHMNPPEGVTISNGLGTYTKNATNGIVEFNSISQNVTVTVTNTDMQTYAVVEELTKADVSYDTTPTYGANFTFTVTIDNDCTQVEVSYKIGNGNYVVLNNPTVNGKSYTYTIAGANITGVVTIKAVGSSGYTVTLNTDGSCQVANGNAELTSPTGYTATFQPNIASHSGYLKYMFDVNINGVESTRFSTDGTLTLTSNEVTGPVSISAKTYWNGQSPSADASSTFSGGTGASEQDPYILKDAYDLALLSSNVNAGTNYSGKYFKMANDIYLDIYKYDFNEESGFVRIKNYDDTILACVGQGITGTTTNTTGVVTSIYPASADTLTTLPATLSEYPATFTPNTWVPIGTYSNSFAGNFDGGNNSVSGICYISKSDYLRVGGLFSYANAEIKNCVVEEAFLFIVGYQCGVGGVVYSGGTCNNCSFNGCILVYDSGGYSSVGGVIGSCDSANSCVNWGFVNVPESYLGYNVGTGGVFAGGVGPSDDGNFRDNINYGYVYGEVTGGLLGHCHSNASVDLSFAGQNLGKVNGIESPTNLVGLFKATPPEAEVCFPANTLISSEYGYKNIQDVQIGDMVWTYNEVSGEFELKRVYFTRVVEATAEVIHIGFGDTTLTATHNHEFLTQNRGWVSAKELTFGDVLIANGEYLQITSYESEIVKDFYYNFSVEDNHNYLVSNKNIVVDDFYCQEKRWGIVE